MSTRKYGQDNWLTNLFSWNSEKSLLITIFSCNLASGYTTISGAIQIFPQIVVGGIAGTFIQLLLFLLTASNAASNAKVIKWTSASFLATLSIYTSFFAYYSQLTSKQQDDLAENLALTAHFKLVEEVFTPLQDEFIKSETSYLNKKEEAQIEESKGFTAAGSGRGPETIKLEKEYLDLKRDYEEWKKLIEEIDPLFNYSIDDLVLEDSPEEDRNVLALKILKKDRNALAAVPIELRPENLKSQQNLTRSEYIDEDQDISLLAPYHKVKKHDEPALVSMGLAVGLDSVILFLGIARSIRRRKKQGFISGVVSSIQSVKEGVHEISIALVQEPIPRPTIEQQRELGEVLETVQSLGISVSSFLGNLMHLFAEDEKGLIIDASVLYQRVNLNNSRSSTMFQQYISLFETMQTTLEWLESYQPSTTTMVQSQFMERKWRIKNNACRKCLISWLRKEMKHYSREENPRFIAGSHTSQFRMLSAEDEDDFSD